MATDRAPSGERRGSAPTLPPGVAPVIGLVGGIGSGKSLVAEALARKGGKVLVADAFGHEALRQPDLQARVVSRWGRELLNPAGEVDRKKLASIVFNDPGERRALEAIVHPWIATRIVEEVTAARKDPAVRLIVLDAAIMLEAGWDRVRDKLVFVDTPRDQRLARLREQRGWTEAELDAREAAQMPLTEKRARADHGIDNSASLADLERQVDDLHRSWGLPPRGTVSPGP